MAVTGVCMEDGRLRVEELEFPLTHKFLTAILTAEKNLSRARTENYHLAVDKE